MTFTSWAVKIAAFVLLSSLSTDNLAGTAPLDPVLTTIQSGFSGAVAVRNAGDGSNRLFVVQKNGRIKIIEDDGALLNEDFIKHFNTYQQWR